MQTTLKIGLCQAELKKKKKSNPVEKEAVADCMPAVSKLFWTPQSCPFRHCFVQEDTRH